MDFEIVDIIAVLFDIHGLHPLQHPAHEAGPFVTREIEAAALPQVLQQMLELGVGFCCRAHPTSSLVTRLISAFGISANGSTKSTAPVCIAAPGMPKNSELFSSCTITVPPIFLIARTPMEPSLPVPVRTTAMARSLKLAATDSNNKSADGRTKWTSSDCVSDKVPSEFTSRWRFGGAM